jgi:bifunctional non-homologous end joining protein LigD
LHGVAPIASPPSAALAAGRFLRAIGTPVSGAPDVGALSSADAYARCILMSSLRAESRRKRTSPAAQAPTDAALALPSDTDSVLLDIDGRDVRLTNLRKPFWAERGITKGDLLRYYAAVAPALLPHVADRAMVMKRYPNGAAGECFFMKRAPQPRPPWIETCSITHGSGNVIAFPIVQDVASLLWVVNLGCIDLNPWYARCDDVDRPDFLHFDLDPVPPATFDAVRATALVVRDALTALRMPAHVKTTGSKGVHVYVPIVRGPTQKAVWTFAKQLAILLAGHHPDLITAEYRIAKRPAGRVLVDYNQNAWGRTLASVYSPRPTPLATVSTPLTWQELEGGAAIDDFRIDNVPARIAALGDLWAPLADRRKRFDLAPLLAPPARTRTSRR